MIMDEPLNDDGFIIQNPEAFYRVRPEEGKGYVILASEDPTEGYKRVARATTAADGQFAINSIGEHNFAVEASNLRRVMTEWLKEKNRRTENGNDSG